LIEAVHVKETPGGVGVEQDEAHGVVGTLGVVAVSQDGDGLVADPAVPGNTQQGALIVKYGPLRVGKHSLLLLSLCFI